MDKKKTHIGILFGGRSAEHEVSIRSARSIYAAIDKEKYDVSLIGIDSKGSWYFDLPEISLPESQESTPPVISNEATPKADEVRNLNEISRRFTTRVLSSSKCRTPRDDKNEENDQVDVIFPVLHGPYGEDGTVQGFLRLMNLPFVGAGVLGSAVGMDKDVMKRLLRDADIPISDFLVLKKGELVDKDFVKKKLGLPVFIKPANLGSSVGVSKVMSLDEMDAAMSEAFRFDNKIIIESYIEGRELEVAVLGNDDPEVSVVGEIKPTHEFYSYEAKYLDENGAELVIPAAIDKKTAEEVRTLAKLVFQVLECSDLARVDFFLRNDGKVFVNEINTIPGFTSISMYPKLWEASGIPYAKLIERLVQLAFTRYNNDQRLQTTYST